MNVTRTINNDYVTIKTLSLHAWALTDHAFFGFSDPNFQHVLDQHLIKGLHPQFAFFQFISLCIPQLVEQGCNGKSISERLFGTWPYTIIETKEYT